MSPAMSPVSRLVVVALSSILALAPTIPTIAQVPPTQAPPTQPPSSQDPSSQPPSAPEAETPAEPEVADWTERLMYNSDERTRRGRSSLEAKEYAPASAAMDAALRLAPEEALARYNAGTARLPTRPEEARPLLESLVDEEVESSLASRAAYNLGNLHLEANRLQEAIDAYKDSLRRDPDFEDAKHNLELAQRRLREQQENQDQQNQDQQDQEQQQDQENQDQQDQEQQQDQENQDQQDQQNQDQEQQDQEQQQDQQSQDQDQQDQEQQQDQQNQDQQDQQGQEQEQESPLPQFQDLEDMTAEEAAAILEAIENMEREQRRQKALEAAKAQVGKKKDW